MSDFKAKMHQIRFLLELCPRSCWGSLHTPPDLLAVFKGPASKGSDRIEGREGEGGELLDQSQTASYAPDLLCAYTSSKSHFFIFVFVNFSGIQYIKLLQYIV